MHTNYLYAYYVTTMPDQMQPATTEPPERWAAWQMFFEAHAAVCARLEAALQERHGLSLRWYDVLLHLYAAPPGG